MKVATVFASAFIGSVAAFAPSAPSKSAQTVARLTLDELGGGSLPLKNFDPLRLSLLGEESTLRWFRAAELKHSRVAMLATAGYAVNAAGFHFPGMLSDDVSFESLSKMNPFDAWDAVPDIGKAQIIGSIFVAEIAGETKDVHYTKGGSYPTIVFPPIDYSGVDAKTLETNRTKELNNGRLAMIAIMGFISAHNIPGSVPSLEGTPFV